MRTSFKNIIKTVGNCFMLLAGLVCLNSCSGPNVRTDLDTTSSGIINISVDETFKPIIDSQIEVFEALYPKAKIVAHYKPEADCLRDLIKDSATRMVIVTRGLTDNEEIYFRDSLKYIPLFDKVANDAVAVIVSNQSADSVITMEKIRALLEGNTADKEKVVFDGTSATSTVRFAVDSILRGKPLNGDKVVGVKNSEEVINYVAEHNDVIGLIGVSWVGDKEDSNQVSFLKKVKIASVECSKCGDNIFVKPYQFNILYKRYPLVRGLYYILKENYDGLGNGFANFLTQEKGQLIFRRAYLGPAKMDFTLRTVTTN
ncbi:PstS family phosphate ABC transporter substrate-binding protein [Ferruginibacter albus]|uniref:PstS family phosphate ABC transporter substrate-binding protein n=1 Tax=Ferruginibacter albus TaxID=2875540 RepID=UPI001CC6A322|nr:substrate-binding domain-containing protein [Ferruginibacter albus]UAY51587.1 substrate-binding domain-containing protein [Ferruginibacter albus]